MGYWMQRAKHLRGESPNVDHCRSGDRDDQAQGPPTIQPGTIITWQRFDGIPQGPGRVDCLHFEEDGSTWVFVTLPDGWAAINAKYVTVVRTF